MHPRLEPRGPITVLGQVCGRFGERLLAQPGTAMILALLMALAGGCAPSQQASVDAAGKAVFDRYCGVCHGPDGDGQGPASYLLFPKPRNFIHGQFKLRSTPMGTLPTDDDLVRTVSNGIPGTAMFAFGEVLSETEVRLVVDYLKTLSPVFENAEPITADQLLDIPTAPPPTPEMAATGGQIYEKFGCGQCHGPEGRGDGPAAPRVARLRESPR